jgi:spore germination protein KC
MKARWMMHTVIVLGMVLLLTSCWNSRELNDLAIVSGIGIDKVPNKEEYQVTFQIVNPSSTATSVGSSTGQPPITVYTTSDRTLFGALRKTSKKASRQLFFAHTQLVIIGESLAESGINDLFDIFERSHELRLNTAILVSRGTDAASILKVLLPVENLPAMGVVKKNANTSRVWGESRKINIFEIINGITGEGELVISGVQIIGSPEEGKLKKNLEQTDVKSIIAMSGLGLFNDGKLKYWMDGSEARGTLWVQNKLEETSINIDSDDEEEAIAVNIILSKTKIKVDIVDGLPVFHVNIKEEGSVNELKSIVDLSNREEMLKLEKELAKKTKAEVMQSLQTAQRMKSDIFNFGNELKRTNPKVWETVQKDWETLFAKGELDVHVEAYIRSTGMRIKSYLSNTE